MEDKPMALSRRRFLKTAAVVAGGMCAGVPLGATVS